MTFITIPLNIGINYISFPATSTDNFDTIFTNSQIKSYIQSFQKYDPILDNYISVNYLEYIEKGRGYILTISSPLPITYDGIEYTLTFQELQSKLLRGWNLVGPGISSIIQSSWCRVLDSEFSPVTFLEPRKAYWINRDECALPSPNIDLMISVSVLALMIYSIYSEKR